MKKLVLIIATLAFTLHGFAQDKYVTSALTALKGKNYDEAKEDIDRAMQSPETKEKPKALYAKATIYTQMQMMGGDKYKASNPYREAAQAIYKLIEVKPDYEKDNVDQMLLAAVYFYYNDGVKAYNDKKYAESGDLMKNVVKIYEMRDARKFDFPAALKSKVDTIAADAYQTLANSAYFGGKYEEAIPLLIKVKNNPITKSAAVYQCLIDAYDKTKKQNESFATIEEGRKLFPEDAVIRTFEINYYITTGKKEELIKKLEAAAAAEPNNADILFSIATTYMNMANPKDGKKPASAAEYTSKSEDAFQRAIKLSPENAVICYNFAALYYNQASEINDQMNAITGSSAADLKKYDDLKVKRDAYFDKSLPYFEKAYTILSAKESSLKAEDMSTYKSTLTALKEVYARLSKMDKSAEMKKKYDALK